MENGRVGCFDQVRVNYDVCKKLKILNLVLEVVSIVEIVYILFPGPPKGGHHLKKHRHRQKVTSHHSLSLLKLFNFFGFYH